MNRTVRLEIRPREALMGKSLILSQVQDSKLLMINGSVKVWALYAQNKRTSAVHFQLSLHLNGIGYKHKIA